LEYLIQEDVGVSFIKLNSGENINRLFADILASLKRGHLPQSALLL
jgi:hypothetical protein